MDPKAPIVDTHTHTRRSDGVASVIENAQAAHRRGCKVMCATDHLTISRELFPEDDYHVPEDELGALAEEIEAARAEVPEVEIVRGFECDWYEGCEADVRRWSAGATFLLGAVHYVGSQAVDDPDDKSLYEGHGANEAWRAYADAWCRACESPASFDSMAHPDLAMRFSREGCHVTCDLTGVFRQMAECAHDTGRHVEVSTAALRKGLGTFYPNHELLVMFREAEVPITVGSDEHRPQDVAWGIERVYAYAFSAGYESFDCPRADGSWTTFEL